MTHGDVSRLLGKAAAYDRRTVGEADVLAWHEAIGDLDPDDAFAAVAQHYRDTTDWIMPAHVRRIAKELARDRYRRASEERAARALEAERAVPRGNRSAEVAAFVQQIRGTLPPGNPDKLRRPEWVELEKRQDRARRADTQPNPHFAGWANLPPADQESA